MEPFLRIIGLLIILFGAGMIATASILLARKFGSVESGSCCLPAPCDVSKLDESVGIDILNRSYGFCNISAEQATAMGCPGAHNAMTTQCSLSNSHLCSRDANELYVLVAGICGIVGGVCFLIAGAALMLGVEPSLKNCPSLVLLFSAALAVILSGACLVFAAMFFHNVNVAPFSSEEAEKCTRRASTSRQGQDDSTSRCIHYEYSIFHGDVCPYADQRAHVLNWMLDADKLKSVGAAMVALPCLPVFAALVGLVVLLKQLCCR